MMSSSDSLTSSGKGGTDDNSDSNTSEDIPDKDENEASASKDDSGKTNAEDKPQSSLEKNGDNWDNVVVHDNIKGREWLI